MLDALRDALRTRGMYPLLFDFPPPGARDVRETVKVLAGLSAFVIADVSDASSVPLELEALVTDYLIPFVIVKQEDCNGFAMLDTLYSRARDRLSEPHAYADTQRLLDNLDDLVCWAQARTAEFSQRKRAPVVFTALPRRRS